MFLELILRTQRIEADHDADDEPAILTFPSAERERPKVAPPVGKIKRQKFLGGLLSHYERVAA